MRLFSAITCRIPALVPVFFIRPFFRSLFIMELVYAKYARHAYR